MKNLRSIEGLLTTGQFLTATATDTNGNTSEFSACKMIQSGPVQPSRVFLPAVVR